MKELLISAGDRETRVAVLEDGRVTEVQIERRRQRGVVGNIYKGRVTRVLPGMQSAFVDLGLEKDAFLYVADVGEEVDDFDRFGSAEEEAEPLKSLPEPTVRIGWTGLKGEGEGVPSRLAPLDRRASRRAGRRRAGDEGPDREQGRPHHLPRLLPGRTLVFMPTVDHVGVSRRIDDEEERRRLKEILEEIRRSGAAAASSSARPARTVRARTSTRDARYLRGPGTRCGPWRRASGAPAAAPPRALAGAAAARDILGEDIASSGSTTSGSTSGPWSWSTSSSPSWPRA